MLFIGLQFPLPHYETLPLLTTWEKCVYFSVAGDLGRWLSLIREYTKEIFPHALKFSKILEDIKIVLLEHKSIKQRIKFICHVQV